MDEDENLPQRLKAIEESVERVYGVLRTTSEQHAQILASLSQRSQSEADAVRSYMAMLGGMHVQEAMLLALIATHPDKTKLHIAFTQFWEVYRSGIGGAEVNDAVRQAAEQTLARFGTALGIALK